MAKARLPAVEADFVSVISLLKDWNVIEKSPAATVISAARRIHSATFSLILWRFRLKKLPVHSRVFIDEIASDALQILPQVLLGYSKTSTLLTRGIIENVFRHIYFTDHVIEFGHMNGDRKWYMAMDDLYAYAKKHPLIVDAEPQFDAVNRLSSLYSDLSAGVHGRTVDHLETRASLKKIRYDHAACLKHLAAIEQCAASANFLLAVFHKAQVQNFAAEDRRIILRAMPPAARQVWMTANS